MAVWSLNSRIKCDFDSRECWTTFIQRQLTAHIVMQVGNRTVDAAEAAAAEQGRGGAVVEWWANPAVHVNDDYQSVFPPVELILPIFARERVGWYNWGLVAGRTQTYLDWRPELNTPDSVTWQHDIFRDDGEPYDEEELRLIQSFSFSG